MDYHRAKNICYLDPYIKQNLTKVVIDIEKMSIFNFWFLISRKTTFCAIEKNIIPRYGQNMPI